MTESTSTIGSIHENEYHLRGEAISKLMREKDFVSVAWLAWMSRFPTEKEKKLLQASLVACVDHGEEPPSARVSRWVASCGKSLADAVAAGLLTLGPKHGNAGSATTKWLIDAVSNQQSVESVVDQVLQTKERLPGLGHKVYSVDPRAEALMSLVLEEYPDALHTKFIQSVSKLLSERKNKPLPVNIDGAIGAMVADLDVPLFVADAIFLCARSIGLVAHVVEEQGRSETYRRGV